MAYIITGETVGLALDTVSQSASDLDEALRKARQMYDTGLVNISVEDERGHKIEGDELLACLTGKKTITEDLEAK